jgi:hypothetical protein
MDKRLFLKALENYKLHYLAHKFMVSPSIAKKINTMEAMEAFRKVKPHGRNGWNYIELHFLYSEAYHEGWNNAIEGIIKGLKKTG